MDKKSKCWKDWESHSNVVWGNSNCFKEINELLSKVSDLTGVSALKDAMFNKKTWYGRYIYNTQIIAASISIEDDLSLILTAMRAVASGGSSIPLDIFMNVLTEAIAN